MNTPSQAEKRIRASKSFKGSGWFTTMNLTKDTGMEGDYLNGILRDMVEAKSLVVNHNMGRAAHYKQPNKSLYVFIRGPWRKHTNEELGLQPEYAWSVM